MRSQQAPPLAGVLSPPPLPQRCIALFEEEVARAEGGDGPPEAAGAARSVLGYAHAHLAVIKAWGRFPHRNAILGR